MYKPKFLKPESVYPQYLLKAQNERYQKAVEKYRDYFRSYENPERIRIFSAPGRTEICGNHTDHNHGKVLAASVNLDIIAVAEPIEAGKIAIKSEGFPEAGVWFDNLKPDEEEKNTPEALIRGVCEGFVRNGYKIGGFKAYTTSDVLKGSGLSSSAAFEILIGTILSYMYNNGRIEPLKLAQIGQFAENKYFGKPCGLMDQTACAAGGFVAVDLKDNAPVVETIDFEFESVNHALCIIDTKSGHDDLTAEYASIPEEMKKVAVFFDVEVLRQISRQDILLNINRLRKEFGDRTVLRALHFFNENDRVDRMTRALKNKDFDNFLSLVRESGESSFKYLQNVYTNSDIKNQPLSIGLHISEIVLGRKGACRVHGGGFAGTIQAFVPQDLLKSFKLEIETVFGANSCHVLTVRRHGSVEIDFPF